MEAGPGVTEYLLSLGLPGLIILGLAIAVRRLFGLYTDSQEKRIEEAGKYQVALSESTAQQRLMTQMLEALTRSTK